MQTSFLSFHCYDFVKATELLEIRHMMEELPPNNVPLESVIAPPNSPAQVQATPSLFRPLFGSISASPAGWLDQLVPFTPKSNVSKLGSENSQQYVPQIATPHPEFSPWRPCHIVPQKTPERNGKAKKDQEIGSNSDTLDQDGVVPFMDLGTKATTLASSSSSPSSEKVEHPPKKRCKRYLV